MLFYLQGQLDDRFLGTAISTVDEIDSASLDITRTNQQPLVRCTIENANVDVFSTYAAIDQEAGKLCISKVRSSRGYPVSQPERDANYPYSRAERTYTFLRLSFGPLSLSEASKVVCGGRVLPDMIADVRDVLVRENRTVILESQRYIDSVVHMLLSIVRPLVRESAWFNYHTMFMRLVEIAEANGFLPVVENVFQHTSLNTDLLSAAAELKYLDSVERLTKYAGIRVNSRDTMGYTPLIWACISGEPDLVEQLSHELIAGVNEFSSDLETPLLAACRYYRTKVAKLLIQIEDVDVNVQDGNSNTALHLVIIVSARNGRTRLHDACVEGNFNKSRQVLFAEAAADINAQDNNGWSALHIACLKGHSDIARLLVWAGADVNLTDNDGSTPINLALDAGFKKMPDIVSMSPLQEVWLPTDFPFYVKIIGSNDHG